MKPIVVKAVFNTHQSQGQTLDQLKQFYPSQYQELLNYYMGSQSSDMQAALGGADLETIQNIPGKKLRDKVVELLGDVPEITDSVRSIQKHMTLLMAQAKGIAEMAKGEGEKSYFAGWVVKPEKRAKVSGELLSQGSEGYTSPGAIESFITGDSGQSISRILREGATARLNPDTGLDFTDIARDPDFIARGLESITALTDLAGPKTPDDSQAKCANLGNKVMRRGKKLVFLTGTGSTSQVEGLVMPENAFLSYAVKKAEERCPENKIQEVPRSYSSGELNAVRGPAFETGIVGSTVFAGLIGETDEALKSEVYGDLVDWMGTELFKDAKKFSASMVKLRRFRDLESAEDVQGADLGDLFESFNDKFGDTPGKFKAFMELVSNLREIQNTALKMGADMAFPVAKEKGVGYSDDVVNLYRDPEKAKKGMAKLGLETGEPHSVTLGELKQKDKVLAGLYAKRFGLTDDSQNIYLAGEGVKAYENPTEVKLGEVGRQQRKSEVILQAGMVVPKGTPKLHKIDPKTGEVKKKNKEEREGNPEVYDGTEHYMLEEYKPGTSEKVQERLWGSNETDRQQGLKSVQDYQRDTLDHIFRTVNSLLPSDMTVEKDEDGNILELNYESEGGAY